MKSINFCLEQFELFHKSLMCNAPEGYIPHYFKCGKDSKAPEPRIRWKQAKMTYDQSINWIKEGGNIGLAGMEHDPLQIIDCDNDEILTMLKQPTLTTKGRSRRGGHGWYWAEGEGLPTNIPVTDKGECRGVGQYVVAPGSYIESPEISDEYSGYYTVEKAFPPNNIRFDELPEVFRKQLEKDRINPPQPRPPISVPTGKHSALFDLTIENIIGYHKDDERFEHPYHGSECSKGHNFSISKGLGHCWRDLVSLNAVQLLVVMSGYKNCRDAGTGHKDAPKMGYLDDGDIFHAWLYAKKSGLIPRDDPIPVRAIKYIVVKHNIKHTIKDDHVDRVAYHKALWIVEREY